MSVLCDTLNTVFQADHTKPFYIQVDGEGSAFLQSRGTSAYPWVSCTPTLGKPGIGCIPSFESLVAGIEYRFIAVSGSPQVLAVQ